MLFGGPVEGGQRARRRITCPTPIGFLAKSKIYNLYTKLLHIKILSGKILEKFTEMKYVLIYSLVELYLHRMRATTAHYEHSRDMLSGSRG